MFDFKCYWVGLIVMSIAWLCILPEDYPSAFVVGQLVAGCIGLYQSIKQEKHHDNK